MNEGVSEDGPALRPLAGSRPLFPTCVPRKSHQAAPAGLAPAGLASGPGEEPEPQAVGGPSHPGSLSPAFGFRWLKSHTGPAPTLAAHRHQGAPAPHRDRTGGWRRGLLRAGAPARGSVSPKGPWLSPQCLPAGGSAWAVWGHRRLVWAERRGAAVPRSAAREPRLLRPRVLASLWALPPPPPSQGPRARTVQGRGRHGEGQGDTALRVGVCLVWGDALLPAPHPGACALPQPPLRPPWPPGSWGFCPPRGSPTEQKNWVSAGV